MDKKEYVVTDAAGSRPDIANRLRLPGDVVMLTDREAEWELKRGAIVTPAELKRRQAAAEVEARASAVEAGHAEPAEILQDAAHEA